MALTSVFRVDDSCWGPDRKPAPITTWADVQDVPSSGFDAHMCKLMYERQMESIGAMTWATRPRFEDILQGYEQLDDGVALALDWACSFGLDRDSDERHSLTSASSASALDDMTRDMQYGIHLRVFHQAADSGPDQIGMDKEVCADIEKDPFTIKTSEPCICHQGALIVERQLRLNPCKYWATMAKAVHAWRSSGNTKILCDFWKEHWGEAEAAKVFARLPQRPIKGRWGVISKTEEHFLRAQLPRCGLSYKALGETAQARRDSATTKKLNAIADLQALADAPGEAGAIARESASHIASVAMELIEVDEAGSNQLAVGRFMRDAVQGMQDKHHWAVTHIRNTTGAPIEHLFNWQMQGGPGDLRPIDDVPGEWGHMARLVFYKAAELCGEFDDMLLLDIRCGPWESLWDMISYDDIERYTALIVLNVCHNALEFDWRIVRRCKAFPARSFWLVFMPHDVVCEKRRAEATFILHFHGGLEELARTQDVGGKQFVVKFRFIFKDALVEAAETGTFDISVWCFVKDMADNYLNESREVEGAHNILKYMQKIAPNIHTFLSSSRLSIRKFLAQCTKQEQEEFLVDCVDFHGAAKEYMKADRFKPLVANAHDDAGEPKTDIVQTKLSILPPQLAAIKHVDRLVADAYLRLKRSVRKLSKGKGMCLEPDSLHGMNITCSRCDVPDAVNLVGMCCSSWRDTKYVVCGLAEFFSPAPEGQAIGVFTLMLPLRKAKLADLLRRSVSFVINHHLESVSFSCLTFSWDRNSGCVASIVQQFPLGTLGHDAAKTCAFKPNRAIDGRAAPGPGRRGRGKLRGRHASSGVIVDEPKAAEAEGDGAPVDGEPVDDEEDINEEVEELLRLWAEVDEQALLTASNEDGNVPGVSVAEKLARTGEEEDLATAIHELRCDTAAQPTEAEMEHLLDLFEYNDVDAVIESTVTQSSHRDLDILVPPIQGPIGGRSDAESSASSADAEPGPLEPPGPIPLRGHVQSKPSLPNWLHEVGWADKFQTFSQAALHHMLHCQAPGNNVLSYVCLRRDNLFYNTWLWWDLWEDRVGRETRIDRNTGANDEGYEVVYQLPNTAKSFRTRTMELLIPNALTSMKRYREGGLRESLPRNVARIWRFFEHRGRVGPSQPAAAQPCSICRAPADFSDVCALCGATTHAKCLDELWEAADTDSIEWVSNSASDEEQRVAQLRSKHKSNYGSCAVYPM